MVNLWQVTAHTCKNTLEAVNQDDPIHFILGVFTWSYGLTEAPRCAASQLC